MRALSAGLGVEIHEEELPGFEGKALRTVRSILLSPSGYAPRDEFTIAHELMELHIPASWRVDLPHDVKERLCDRGAAALLLPAAPFLADAKKYKLDLLQIRPHWPLASWDTTARRLVDVGAASSAAAWNSLELDWRHGGAAHHDEEEALGVIYSGRGRAAVGKVLGWRLGGRGLGRAVTVAG